MSFANFFLFQDSKWITEEQEFPINCAQLTSPIVIGTSARQQKNSSPIRRSPRLRNKNEDCNTSTGPKVDLSRNTDFGSTSFRNSILRGKGNNT